MERTERAVAALVVLVLLVAGAWLLAGPARETHDDIAAQRRLVAAQLTTLQQALQVQHEQLAIAREQLQVSQQTESLVRESLGATQDLKQLAQQLLTAARSTDAKAADLAALSHQLLTVAATIQRIAVATEQHAANLDRKVP